MKIKLNVVPVLLFSALFFQGCNTDSSENPRAYAEGKVVSAAVNYNTFFLRILSGNVIVAETMLESGGGFKVSGPIEEGLGVSFLPKSMVRRELPI